MERKKRKLIKSRFSRSPVRTSLFLCPSPIISSFSHLGVLALYLMMVINYIQALPLQLERRQLESRTSSTISILDIEHSFNIYLLCICVFLFPLNHFSCFPAFLLHISVVAFSCYEMVCWFIHYAFAVRSDTFLIHTTSKLHFVK